MTLSHETIKKLLEQAGLKPTPQDLEITSRLHETLTQQLDQFSEQKLEGVEPYYIQPARRPRLRTR